MMRGIFFIMVVALLLYAFGQASGDSIALSMLRDAREARYYFPESFEGFTASVTVNDDGRPGAGELSYNVKGSADLDLSQDPGSTDAGWIIGQIVAMIGRHLQDDTFKEYERFPLTLAGDDGSPLGRLVLINDPTKASLRIRDGRITSAEKTINGQRRIITVLAETDIGAGKFLPHNFTVSYLDSATGQIQKTEAYTTEYTQTGGLWFPSSQQIVKIERGKKTARTVEIHEPKIRHGRRERAGKYGEND